METDTNILRPRTVMQTWVCGLSFMQQSVLITCVRSPDGLEKNHVAKLLLRWFRRCVMLNSFEHRAMETPFELGGGSFTGPSTGNNDPDWHKAMDDVLTRYLLKIDEIPLHFHLHFMHASEILGYKHPIIYTKEWWHRTYNRIVNDMHLHTEFEWEMNKRLGDTFEGWNERNDPAERASGP